MRFFLAFVVLFSATYSSWILAGQFTPPQFGAKSLTGTVRTGRYPVSGAVITVKNAQTGKTKRATTNKDGYFSIHGLDLGLYAVTVEVEGYKTESKSVIVSEGIGGGHDFDLVPVGESALSVIQGTVKDKKNQSIEGAQVEIFEKQTRRSHDVKTDSSGFYKKVGLVPGPYRITATAKGYSEANKNLTLKPATVNDVDFKLKQK